MGPVTRGSCLFFLGVIPKAGTDPCVLPETTTAEYQIKAPTERGLHVLSEKLHHCFEGAATATGCRVSLCLVALLP